MECLKALSGKDIYNKFLIYPFDNSVGMLMDLFRQNCFVNVIKNNPALVYVYNDALEATPAFRLLYTKEKFIEWVQPVVRDAYRSKGYEIFFSPDGWNDADKIGAIWNAILGD